MKKADIAADVSLVHHFVDHRLVYQIVAKRRYPCALSKILGFLWLRIVKNGMKKADIAAGKFHAVCSSVPNSCNMKRICCRRCSLGLEMP